MCVLRIVTFRFASKCHFSFYNAPTFRFAGLIIIESFKECVIFLFLYFAIFENNAIFVAPLTYPFPCSRNTDNYYLSNLNGFIFETRWINQTITLHIGELYNEKNIPFVG